MAAGFYVLHEHPAGATSWRVHCVEQLAQSPVVGSFVAHMCAFGMTSTDDEGRVGPVLKPTRFLSNSPPMLRRLSKLCKRDHVHQKLEGGKRTQMSSFHPLPLLKAILQGITDTQHCTGMTEHLVEDEYEASLLMNVSTESSPEPNAVPNDPQALSPGTLPVEGGGTVQIHYKLQDFKHTYLDEYTREPLPHKLVMSAIQEELEYFNRHVWELSDAKRAMGDAEAKLIRTRWVICNKGDAESPDIRARLVATELNTFKPDDFFSLRPHRWRRSASSFLRWHAEGPQRMGAGFSYPLWTSGKLISTACQNASFSYFCRARWGSQPRQWPDSKRASTELVTQG